MLPLLVDAHEDIAYNILNFGRNYNQAASETRQLESESGSLAPEINGETLLGWPDYQRGRVAVVFSTLFVTPARRKLGEWDKQSYANLKQAHELYHNQLDTYRKLADENPDHFRFIASRQDLAILLAHWADPSFKSHPVGLVPLMEGAEGVQTPLELSDWWEWGLRIIGPAWAGTRFCGGTREPGPLTDDGRQLLKVMAELDFTLDLSHMDELSVRQALDIYPGSIIVSHANIAELLLGYEGNRLLHEKVIMRILERNGIIGVVPFCSFLASGWKVGDSRAKVTLEALFAHIDRICQMAGNAEHVGLGSDFDGGFGLASVPHGVDTIADLQKLGPMMQARGYNDEQVAAILGKNWLRHLQENLP